MTALPRSIPLERKLPLLILALLGIVVVASLGVSYYEVRRTAELTSADRLASLTSVLAQMSEQSTNTRTTQMRRVALDTAITGALADPTRPLSAAARHALTTLAQALGDTASPAQLLTKQGTAVGGTQAASALELPSDDRAVRDA